MEEGFKVFDTNTQDSSNRSRQTEPKLKSLIIPIERKDTVTLSEKGVPITSPNLLIGPSKVCIATSFPLRPGFAITVDKAQGQTMERVIIALSKREQQLSDFTYACVYVAVSRVRKPEHLRLLLTDMPSKRLQWETLVYLTNLRKEQSIDSYFSGFTKSRSGWKDNRWKKQQALAHFHSS